MDRRLVALAFGRAVVHDVLDVAVEKEIGEILAGGKSRVAVCGGIDSVFSVLVFVAVKIIITIKMTKIVFVKIGKG